MRADLLCIVWDCTFEYVNEEGFLPPIPGEIQTISELLEHLQAAAARPPHALRMDLPDDFRRRFTLAVRSAQCISARCT